MATSLLSAQSKAAAIANTPLCESCKARTVSRLPSHVGLALGKTVSRIASSRRQQPRLYSAGGRAAGVVMSSDEKVFFDGGPHYGDLVFNLALGFTVFWLPLTVAAAARNLLARYRFTDERVTVIGGISGGDRKDFAYKDVKDVRAVSRFIGEWGDVVVELRDGSKLEFKSLPKFREIEAYIKERSAEAKSGKGPKAPTAAKGFA